MQNQLKGVLFGLVFILFFLTPSYAVLQDVTSPDSTAYSEDIISALKQIDIDMTQIRNEQKLIIENGVNYIVDEQKKANTKLLIGVFAVLMVVMISSRLITWRFKQNELTARKTAEVLKEQQETGTIGVNIPPEQQSFAPVSPNIIQDLKQQKPKKQTSSTEYVEIEDKTEKVKKEKKKEELKGLTENLKELQKQIEALEDDV